MEMNGFISCSLPTREGIAAWAAAAATAGALLPGAVAQVLLSHNWDEHGDAIDVEDVEDLWDAYSVLEAVASAARHVYRQEASSSCPMPRGMEVGIGPDGRVGLVWQSDSHIITLRFGGGWSTADLDRGGPGRRPHWAPDMSTSVLMIQGSSLEALRASPRTAAALAASSTLQEQGWSPGYS
jgi:hypothetical protein